MPSAVVVGGGPAGLAAALALHQNGWGALVVEGSPPPPTAAPSGSASSGPPSSDLAWYRPSVPQAQQSHTFTSLGVRTLRRRAPAVLDALLAAGAEMFDLTTSMPQHAADSARQPQDDELVALACRRTTFELVLHRYVAALPRVRIRYLTQVVGVTLASDRPVVSGVVTKTGDVLSADVVIDATGRRAASRAWLDAAGHPVGEDLASPSGVTGFTRFYRLSGSRRPGPLNRGHAAGDVFDHYAGVLHPGDGGTFSIAIGTLPGDRELSALRTPAGFTAAAEATPWLSPWLADGVSVPISPVRALACPPNALRAAATTPVVAGLYPVGDAACVTNPLFGRGMSLAMAHAFELADLLAAHPAADQAQADTAAGLADALYRPWYEHAVLADQARTAQWRMAITQISGPIDADGASDTAGTGNTASTRNTADAPGADSTDSTGRATDAANAAKSTDSAADSAPPPAALQPGRPSPRAVLAAAATDATVWRGMTRMAMTLSTPGEVFADEAFTSRVARASAAATPNRLNRPSPPTRAALVNAVAMATQASEALEPAQPRIGA
ncbi:MAG TPA: FAD-dependent oxidoreductase [Actinocrinis sp.]|uniref:NAD(P)/FAD-dependent oxidoreductase n=1 Tax=Actinocrinis sp. TaxID=1920516 RepID=UPI002DDCDE10|nr:FAD-dependent oxidoreductase [Actinocrinis sp.]HEV2347676.1 FAD-dependent oxidoreductase [Actinocrinis sp.]